MRSRENKKPNVYNFFVERFSWWRIGSGAPHAASPHPKRIGYYLWHFPTLTETFIQREIHALSRAGLEVLVFADAAEDVELLDDAARALMQETHYLDPIDRKRLSIFKRHFFSKNPIRYLNLLLYTILHRHSAYKSPEQDVRVFEQAVYLAGSLQAQHVGHLHSPWANLSAFIALLASRLAGMPYSVQARASADLYRDTSRYGLAEKFENAKFIITNARFNRSFIELAMPQPPRVPVHVIYEGLDLSQFNPRQTMATLSAPARILSVARLIPEKGLVYLLRALKQLQSRGCSFHCQIIGAPVEPQYASYHDELRALWRGLELQDSVSFLGALPFDQVLKKFEGADIFVLPCVTAENGGRDVTPNALMEAMAMGLPVISTNMTGITEIVENGVSGLLVPPKNDRALAHALQELIADAALRTRLGQNARAKVAERFNIDKNILQYLELFKPALTDVNT